MVDLDEPRSTEEDEESIYCTVTPTVIADGNRNKVIMLLNSTSSITEVEEALKVKFTSSIWDNKNNYPAQCGSVKIGVFKFKLYVDGVALEKDGWYDNSNNIYFDYEVTAASLYTKSKREFKITFTKFFGQETVVQNVYFVNTKPYWLKSLATATS